MLYSGSLSEYHRPKDDKLMIYSLRKWSNCTKKLNSGDVLDMLTLDMDRNNTVAIQVQSIAHAC